MHSTSDEDSVFGFCLKSTYINGFRWGDKIDNDRVYGE